MWKGFPWWRAACSKRQLSPSSPYCATRRIPALTLAPVSEYGAGSLPRQEREFTTETTENTEGKPV